MLACINSNINLLKALVEFTLNLKLKYLFLLFFHSEVDLTKHDPEGIFTPAVREFIQARDYENSGGRKIDVETFEWKDYCGTVEVNF